MKKTGLLLILLLATFISTAQVQSYYSDVDLTKRGMDLKNELATKIINTHTTQLSYSDLWNVLKQTDEADDDASKVYLIYGWENGSDSDCHNDRERDKNDNGGSAANCDWNREHVYPKSLGTPPLGTSGPGSDAHHVRPADVSLNGHRGNKLFADGSGHAGTVNGQYWYPGDEWKGDVARIILYMYLRYGSQCLPSNVGVGNQVASDPDMVDIFLQWNADDPPSAAEDRRNNLLENIQGNRNPFIDNPYLATLIWGGPQAQDRWQMSLSGNHFDNQVNIYPNPAHDKIHIDVPGETYYMTITDTTGKVILWQHGIDEKRVWNIGDLPDDIYFIIIRTDKGESVKKLVKQSH